MAFFRQFTALLWKNALLKWRNPLGSACEAILPLFFIVVMVVIYRLFEQQNFDTTELTDPKNIRTVLPLSVLPARIAMMRNKLAIVPRTPSLRPLVDSFVDDMDALHPALNGSSIGGTGFDSKALQALRVPSFKQAVRIFDSETDLEKYISDPEYDRRWETETGEKIWGAIIFNSGPPDWDYTIRMNLTQVVNTAGDKVDVLRRGNSFTEIDAYREAVLRTTGPPFLQEKGTAVTRQPYPGFLSLQLAIDRWIVNQSVPLNTLDPVKLTARVKDALRRLLPPALENEFTADINNINSTDAVRASAILAAAHQWLREESYAPQQVDFVPFPFLNYSQNGFYGLVLGILSFFLVIGFVYPVSRLIRGLVLEKEMKMREGMKMMGLSDAALFGSWLVTYAIFWAVLSGLITAVSGKTIFKGSDKGNVWALFFLFGLSSTTFSYLISVFFSRAKTASSLGIVIFIAAYFPTFAVSDGSIATSTKMAASLLCPTAFGLSVNALGNLENNGAGATSETVSAVINNFSVSNGFGMMILDTILYGVLAWYIDNVLPAKYREFGVPRPWTFPFMLDYWREVFNMPRKPSAHTDGASAAAAKRRRATASNNKNGGGIFGFVNRLLGRSTVAGGAAAGGSDDPAGLDGASTKVPAVDASFFEEPDNNLRAKEREGRCVSVQKLRKEFDTPDGTKVAVDDVDLTMYEGQIFVLLGHNGAGKTTTISMLTGLLPATDGGAVIFGRDVSTQLSEVRKDLGVCPQHDVLWPELTVREHLQMFTAIKGVPRDRVEAEITKAIADVGLTEKVNTLSSKLSGGQKRKLSVCIALAGGSRVIFLDEPTSGMDPYSRRSTWQILQNAREGRVMVLTTHFMDEADILGDRIAIMADGRVQCSGSPMFLKRRFGVGYILTLIKATPAARVDAILNLIRAHVPDASIATNVGAELSLRLPLTASSSFPAMLAELDGALKPFGVASYGISITSVEDVFLKISAGEHFAGAGSKDPVGQAAANMPASDPTSVTVTIPSGSANGSAASVVPAHTVIGRGPGAILGGAAPASSSSNSTGTTPLLTGLDAVRAGARKEQTGLSVFFRHTWALLIKRWNYSKRDGKALGYQIILPFILIAAGLSLIQSGHRNTFPSYQFSTAQFNADRRVDPNKPKYPLIVPNFRCKAGVGATDSSSIASILSSMPSANGSFSEPNLYFNVASAAAVPNTFGFHTATTEPRLTYQRMSTVLLADRANRAATKYGAYVYTRDGTIIPNQDPTATLPTNNAATYAVFYNSSGLHSAPLFMNLQNSALYRAKNGGVGSITARTHPMPRTEREASLFAALLVFSAAIIFVIAFAFQASSSALYIVKEREVAAKHQQIISGVSLVSYWVSNFIFDLVVYGISAGLAILLAFAFKIKEFTEADADRLPLFLITFLLFGLALIGSTYIMSFFFKSPSSAQNTILFINISAILLIAASQFLSQLADACRAETSLRYIFRLLPSFSFGWNLVILAFLTQLPLIDASCDVFNGITRGADAYLPYNAMELKSGGTSLVFLAVEGLVYFLGVIAIEYVRSKPNLLMYFRRDPIVTDAPIVEDEDVAAEAARVAAQAASGNISDVVLLERLRKVYTGGKVAVRGISYGIPVGEVFGFLGINGAGKTTTLQMLSGDVLPSAGNARLAGYDILTQQAQVRRLLGYCPQFDALLELLTVREHLELYARIKGVPEVDVPRVVDAKLHEMDLRSFANKKAGTLSGGNKRKLSVAIALIGGPPIVFLDEPSTGMDPVARRFMWSVISRIATENKQCSIILTTHSMEEVEALCTRIGIMVGGRLRCLGNAQHLKNRHGSGYMSEVKLLDAPAATVAAVRTQAAMALGGPDVAILTRAQVRAVATALGNPARGEQVSESGAGWAIHAAFVRSGTGTVALQDFAAWWAGEQAAREASEFICAAFTGAQLVERQGTTLRFRLPSTGEPLAAYFAKLERARAEFGVASYTLGQTTLEQIFVQFAGQQDEETGTARGMATLTSPKVEANNAAAAAAVVAVVDGKGATAGGNAGRYPAAITAAPVTAAPVTAAAVTPV